MDADRESLWGYKEESIQRYRGMMAFPDARNLNERTKEHWPDWHRFKALKIGLKICAQASKTYQQCSARVANTLTARVKGKHRAIAHIDWEHDLVIDGVECGCCFALCPFERMVQCTDGHLFCKECVGSYASTMLGSLDANLQCMERSGCREVFPESELRRVLSPALFSLYCRVKQDQEVKSAGLDNLQECPRCDFKVVIEDSSQAVFWCLDQRCLAVTCRECKALDHRPRSCVEAAQSTKEQMDARRHVEEAMSLALIRKCPRCTKGFVKQSGCNNMKCPHCGTHSCYVCRKTIKGYDHFDKPNNCPLWEQVADRHTNEVAEAAKNAMQEYKGKHTALGEDDLCRLYHPCD